MELPITYINTHERDLSDDVQKRFDALDLADSQLHNKGELKLEIETDIYSHILRSGLLNPDNGTVVAQSTALDWTLTKTIE